MSHSSDSFAVPLVAAKDLPRESLLYLKLFLGAAFLIFSGNFLLLNNSIAHFLSGSNVVSPRELCLFLLAILGIFPFLKNYTHPVMRQWSVRLAGILLLMSLTGLIVGLLRGAHILLALQEFVASLGWMLVLILPVLFRGREPYRILLGVFLSLGILAAAGVGIEILTDMRYSLVTARDGGSFVSDSLVRSSPLGLIFLQVAGSLLLMGALEGGRRYRGAAVFFLLGLAIVLSASIMTLSRTLLVGDVAAAVILFSMLARHTDSRALRGAVVLSIGILGVLFLTLVFLMSTKGEDAVNLLGKRYSTLLPGSHLNTPAAEELGGRDLEARSALKAGLDHLFIGNGLGSEFISVTHDGHEKVAYWAHNTFSHMFFKFGTAGALAYVLIGIVLLNQLAWSVRNRKRSAWYETGLWLGLVNVYVCSLFMNAFFQQYLLHQLAFVFGLAVAFRAHPRRIPRGEGM